MTPEILFNCCTRLQEPDWTQFKAIHISGCIDGGEYIEAGQPAASAEFFGIYGIHHSGEAEAITDTTAGADLAEAEVIAAALSARSDLPVELHPALKEPSA
ncbi:MAG: hypothetical protein ACT6R7_16480 [Brevundimonas aurantiaca]|jgi:hypothetical protein|uniref:hypothetical protein n=1 Tax=Brevundimonas aurantiaca TaxID=74316 RepID=UPI004033D6DA